MNKSERQADWTLRSVERIEKQPSLKLLNDMFAIETIQLIPDGY
jgi:hypothetical protein